MSEPDFEQAKRTALSWAESTPILGLSGHDPERNLAHAYLELIEQQRTTIRQLVEFAEAGTSLESRVGAISFHGRTALAALNAVFADHGYAEHLREAREVEAHQEAKHGDD